MIWLDPCHLEMAEMDEMGNKFDNLLKHYFEVLARLAAHPSVGGAFDASSASNTVSVAANGSLTAEI